MSTAYRWYLIRLQGDSISRDGFLRSILKAKNREFWFSNSSHDLEGDARFYRRILLTVEKYLPSGESESEVVESVEWLDLSLIEGKKSSILKIFNPGRNLRGLMVALESALGYGFSASAIQPENMKVESVLSQFEVVRLVGLKVTNVVVSKDCIGRMEFLSKDGIDPANLKPLKGLKYQPDFVKYEAIYRGLRGSFACANSGLVKVSGPLGSRIIELIDMQLKRT